MSSVPMAAPRDQIRDMRAVLENPKVITGIKQIVPKFVTPERLLRICANAIEKTPLLAQCSTTSFLGAVMTSAALGLEPNTIAGHAYLIPYKGRRKVNGQWQDVYDCQFQMGYKGYQELAFRNEACVSFIGLPVFANDEFDYALDDELGDLAIKYRAARRDRGELDGAFSISVFARPSGARGRAAVWMPEEDIVKVREKSQTFTSLRRILEEAQNGDDQRALERARKNFEETPWNAWRESMWAKSAIRKLAKQLPIYGNLLAASEIEESNDAGVIDMEAMSDPDTARSVAAGEEDPPKKEVAQQSQDRPALSAPTEQDLGVIEGGKSAARETAERAPSKRGGGRAKTAAGTAHDPSTGEVLDDDRGRSGNDGDDDRGGDSHRDGDGDDDRGGDAGGNGRFSFEG